MTRARVRHLVLSLLALSAFTAACGGGNGGSKPIVKSFSASPATLPAGGGDVTFTWDVTFATSVDIEPGVGVVSGNSATVALTTGGTFTLTAANSHGTTTATTNVASAPTITVSGRVFEWGPSKNVPVVVLDQPWTKVAVTDTDGRFTITDVMPPYDIAFESKSQYVSVVYRGLTRPDPTLSGVLQPPLDPADYFEPLSGTVAGGAGYPEASGVQTAVSVYSPFGYGAVSYANTSDSTWNAAATWSGHTSTPVKLHALEYQLSGSEATGFLRYGSLDVPSLTSTGGLSGLDIPMTAVPSTNVVSGTLSAPSGYPPATVHLGVSFTSGGSILDTETLTVPGYTLTSGNFALASPAIPGTFVDVLVQQPYPYGQILYGHNFVQSGASGLSIDVPEGPQPLFPPTNAVVGYDTLFAWTAAPGTVSQFIVGPTAVFPNPPPAQGVVIIQAGDTVRIPEVPETGFALLGSTPYNWGVATYGPFATVDDLAGPAGPFGGGLDAYVGYTNSLPFQTGSHP